VSARAGWSKSTDLTPQEQKNVRTAIRLLHLKCRSWKTMARAIKIEPDSIYRVVSGSRTRRIVTARRGDRLESREAPPVGAPASPVPPAPSAPPAPVATPSPSGPAAPALAPSASTVTATTQPLATLSYRDENGDGVFRMEKPQVVVGRGGPGYWVDLKLKTVPDVSRDHLRLRYDEPERRFYIKDLSSLGTTVNGAAIPSSIEVRGGEKVDRNVEVPLPAEAEIGLAGAVFIRFRAEVSK